MRTESDDKQAWQYVINRTVVTTLGKVGCLTLLIAVGALAAGLLLDNLMGTRPWITILFFTGSVPVSMFVIYRVVRSATAHLRSKSPGAEHTAKD